MGARDVEEQLEGALADAITMERALAAIARTAEARLRSEHASVTDAGYWADVKRTADEALRGRAPALHEQQRLDNIAALALHVGADTRAQVLALAAGIEPAEALERLRQAAIPAAPQDPSTDQQEDPRA